MWSRVCHSTLDHRRLILYWPQECLLAVAGVSTTDLRAPLSLHHVPQPLPIARSNRSSPQSHPPLSGRRADSGASRTVQSRSRIAGGDCWMLDRSAGCGNARMASDCCMGSPRSRRGSCHLVSCQGEPSCRVSDWTTISPKTHTAQETLHNGFNEHSNLIALVQPLMEHSGMKILLYTKGANPCTVCTHHECRPFHTIHRPLHFPVPWREQIIPNLVIACMTQQQDSE